MLYLLVFDKLIYKIIITTSKTVSSLTVILKTSLTVMYSFLIASTHSLYYTAGIQEMCPSFLFSPILTSTTTRVGRTGPVGQAKTGPLFQ